MLMEHVVMVKASGLCSVGCGYGAGKLSLALCLLGATVA